MSDSDSKDEPPSRPDAIDLPPASVPDTGRAARAATETDGPQTATAETATNTEAPTVPSQSQSDAAATEPPQRPPTLEQARVFLRDDAVRRESRPRKAAFLAGKGLSPEQIDQLLNEEDENSHREAAAQEATTQEITAASEPPSSSVPPIVTYPEFLARPPRPPPLVTPNVLLGALYGSAAASTLLYGAAKLVLAPMVETLTGAREELHGAAASNLTKLLERLETVVSEVPAAAKEGAAGAAARLAAERTRKGDDGDDEENEDDASAAATEESSAYDDPTEVFHRDVGVQTSLPPSPALAPQQPTITIDSSSSSAATAATPAAAPPPSASALQATRLNRLAESVRSLSEGWAAGSTATGSPGGGGESVLAEIRTTLQVFREEVDKLARPPAYAYGGGFGNYYNTYGTGTTGTATTTSTASSNGGNKYPGYVTTTRNEPDDEIRKAKENIRRVKGALLTTRTFPTAR